MTRNGQPWPDGTTAPCGTRAAYRRHLRHGEQPCDACRLAESRDRNAVYPRLVPDRREVRNNLPDFKPYVYHGTGYDVYEDRP